MAEDGERDSPEEVKLTKIGGFRSFAGGKMTQEDIRNRLRDSYGDRYLVAHEHVPSVQVDVEVYCEEHDRVTTMALKNLFANLPKCCSLWRGRSRVEEELGDWVKSIYPDAEFSVRSLIGRLELDIYIPSIRVGVEFNGDYWHSDAFIMKSTGETATLRHQRKLEAAHHSHVDLLYVWETDWRNRRGDVEGALRAHFAARESLPTEGPEGTYQQLTASPLLSKLTNG